MLAFSPFTRRALLGVFMLGTSQVAFGVTQPDQEGEGTSQGHNPRFQADVRIRPEAPQKPFYILKGHIKTKEDIQEAVKALPEDTMGLKVDTYFYNEIREELGDQALFLQTLATRFPNLESLEVETWRPYAPVDFLKTILPTMTNLKSLDTGNLLQQYVTDYVQKPGAMIHDGTGLRGRNFTPMQIADFKKKAFEQFFDYLGKAPDSLQRVRVDASKFSPEETKMFSDNMGGLYKSSLDTLNIIKTADQKINTVERNNKNRQPIQILFQDPS